MNDLRCPSCGYHLDMPNHEHGCTPDAMVVDTFVLTPDGEMWADELGRPFRLRWPVEVEAA